MAKSSKIRGMFSSAFGFIWFGVLALVILALLSPGLKFLFIDDSENITQASGYTIESYNVVLDVHEDNKVDVTENITVNWNENYHHGITKFTPQWLEYTGKDGNTIKRKSLVLNYRAVGEQYSLDVVKEKPRIKIGSENEYVELGNKLYTIQYTYDMGKDPYKNFDEFIFHAFGDYWGTEIKNASIQVNMPKAINGNDINFFTDKKRNNNVNEFVNYHINGNSLYASFDSEKYYQFQYKEYCSKEYNLDHNGKCDVNSFNNNYNPLEKSLTVDIELPENYFVGGSWNYGYGSLIITIVIFVLTAITIIKWYKYGKDFQKRASTVEFYPPDNLNSAEIGYIYGVKANKKLAISLIVQLASKGYIKIDEINENQKDIQITNLAIKPEELKVFDKTFPKRILEINKLKPEGNDLTSQEAAMMKYLFQKGDKKLLQSNIEKFLEVKDSLINKKYIEVVNDNEIERYASEDEKKKAYEQQVEQFNKNMENYINEVQQLEPLTDLEKIIYDRLFCNENVVTLSKHTTFYKAFDDVEIYLKSKLKDKIEDKNATSKIVGSIIRNILILILSLISYIFVEDLDPSWNILYILSFVCIFINLFFTIIMKRKTEYGEEIKARVLGFRNFLMTAEKPKLEELVSENPKYFYNILPYTYALNVSKIWIKKFENIPMPKINMGSFDYSSDLSYQLFYTYVYYPESVYRESVHSSNNGSSGCSSCGGGCSSCGGGCSSCGGGGSW